MSLSWSFCDEMWPTDGNHIVTHLVQDSSYLGCMARLRNVRYAKCMAVWLRDTSYVGCRLVWGGMRCLTWWLTFFLGEGTRRRRSPKRESTRFQFQSMPRKDLDMKGMTSEVSSETGEVNGERVNGEQHHKRSLSYQQDIWPCFDEERTVTQYYTRTPRLTCWHPTRKSPWISRSNSY